MTDNSQSSASPPPISVAQRLEDSIEELHLLAAYDSKTSTKRRREIILSYVDAMHSKMPRLVCKAIDNCSMLVHHEMIDDSLVNALIGLCSIEPPKKDQAGMLFQIDKIHEKATKALSHVAHVYDLSPWLDELSYLAMSSSHFLQSNGTFLQSPMFRMLATTAKFRHVPKELSWMLSQTLDNHSDKPDALRRVVAMACAFSFDPDFELPDDIQGEVEMMLAVPVGGTTTVEYRRNLRCGLQTVGELVRSGAEVEQFAPLLLDLIREPQTRSDVMAFFSCEVASGSDAYEKIFAPLRAGADDVLNSPNPETRVEGIRFIRRLAGAKFVADGDVQRMIAFAQPGCPEEVPASNALRFFAEVRELDHESLSMIYEHAAQALASSTTPAYAAYNYEIAVVAARRNLSYHARRRSFGDVSLDAGLEKTLTGENIA